MSSVAPRGRGEVTLGKGRRGVRGREGNMTGRRGEKGSGAQARVEGRAGEELLLYVLLIRGGA